jgi:hypothetical protein
LETAAEIRQGPAYQLLKAHHEAVEPRPAQRDRPTDLAAIMDECLKSADGDMNEAALMFRGLLTRADPLKMHQIEADAVRCRLLDMLREHMARVRDNIARSASAEKKTNPRTLAGLRAFSRGWLDWSMSDGTVLRDATRAKLLEDAQHYVNSASTLMSRGQWLQRIAAMLTDDTTTVRQALDEAIVGKLARECGVVKE